MAVRFDSLQVALGKCGPFTIELGMERSAFLTKQARVCLICGEANGLPRRLLNEVDGRGLGVRLGGLAMVVIPVLDLLHTGR